MLRSRSHILAGAAVTALVLASCSSSQPSEREMKNAVQELVQKTGIPGLTEAKIATFKKVSCDKPSNAGVDCTFNLTFTSNDTVLLMLSQQLTHARFVSHQGKWVAQEPAT